MYNTVLKGHQTTLLPSSSPFPSFQPLLRPLPPPSSLPTKLSSPSHNTPAPLEGEGVCTSRTVFGVSVASLSAHVRGPVHPPPFLSQPILFPSF